MSGWAIDLGNSNTRVARWDPVTSVPCLLELPRICKQPGGTEPLSAPRLIPSATDIIEDSGWKTRLGCWPLIARRWFLGRRAYIGRPAIERNLAVSRPSFVPRFKPYLGREALRNLAWVGKKPYTARDVAWIFVRELLAEIKQVTGERLRSAVLTTPVEAFETYRAELIAVGRSLGIKKLRFIDEPVAAALGYGLGLEKERKVLAVDFGAGTLDLALVALSARQAEKGQARVIAKEGLNLGGHLVDQWLLAEFCRTLGYSQLRETEHEDTVFWRRLMLREACRVKEAVFFKPSAIFQLIPPAYMRSAPAAGGDDCPWLEITQERLIEVLEQNDLYGALEGCVHSILQQMAVAGLDEKDIDEVLMVGGSTLLPGVYPLFERRFGRDRVRAWQPFQAVVYGASVFSAGNFAHSDFIVHEYAFETYDRKTHKKLYTVIVPRGTRFPTTRHFWRRKLIPTCALGEPESFFKLVISEVGNSGGDRQRFLWDDRGRLHRVGGEDPPGERIIVPLNEANPTLGTLNPPHSPSDRKPRLDVSFSVNSDRWLCASVYDIKTGKMLMNEVEVVRLL